ncbi:MAG: hypothetical protein V3T30_02420, partial [Thermodesulfobacteriota bacterium]
YYALPLNKEGKLKTKLAFDLINSEDDFVKRAHQYEAKVDLVVYSEDWRDWIRFASSVKFNGKDKFTKNMAKFVKKYGDGIILDFRYFPDDEKSVNLMPSLIKGLRTALGYTRKYSLSILTTYDSIGKGVFNFENIKSLIAVNDTIGVDKIKNKDLQAAATIAERRLNIANTVDHFILFMEEPVTDKKKALRIKVEENLTGIDRKTALRKIVPLLTSGRYSAKDWEKQHYKDDVVYIEDNYGGLGLWPLPVKPFVEKDGKGDKAPAKKNKKGKKAKPDDNFLTSAAFFLTINSGIRDNFQFDNTDDYEFVCKYVCPNRGSIYIVWAVVILVSILLIFVHIIFCKWRFLLKRFFIYYLAFAVMPSIVIGLALLFCDPALSGLSSGNGLLILLIMAVIIYAVTKYELNRRHKKVP